MEGNVEQRVYHHLVMLEGLADGNKRLRIRESRRLTENALVDERRVHSSPLMTRFALEVRRGFRRDIRGGWV